MNYMEMWKSSGTMNLEAMQIGVFTVIYLEQFVSLRLGWGVHVFFSYFGNSSKKMPCMSKNFWLYPVSHAFNT